MIAIEGPDGAGKTVLAKTLSISLGIPRIKREKQDPFVWTLSEMTSWNSTRGMRIYDRFPLISEYIYGPIRRGHVSEDFERVRTSELLDRFYADALIIYCRPPYETIVHNVEHTPQPADIKAHTDNIIRAYDQFFFFDEPSGRFTVVYDYTTHSVSERLLPIVHQHLEAWDSHRDCG